MSHKVYKDKNRLTVGDKLSGLLGRGVGVYIIGALFFVGVCVCYDFYDDRLKTVALTFIIVALLAMWSRRKTLRTRMSLPVCALCVYVLLDGLSAMYAAYRTSGMLALYALLVVLTAFCLVMTLLVMAPGKGREPGRWMATALACYGAVAGLVSIDQISTRIISGPVLWFLSLLTPGYENVGGVEAGVRMTSIFGNGNVFAGVVGLGALLSLGLASTEKPGWRRNVQLVMLYINALAFVLAFSMGGTGMIVLAFLAYLILERRESRVGTLILMLETLILTMISAMAVSMTSLTAWTGIRPVPLLCVILGSAALWAVDKFAGRKLTAKLDKKTKLVPIAVAAVMLVLIAYGTAGVMWTGGTELGTGESLRRAAYPDPGEYTLNAQTSGTVNVSIESQNRQETMMHTSTGLYSGPADGAAFTVPEGSLVVYFNFYSPDGAKLDSATYSGANGSGSLPLEYKLLPGFIANRLQGLFANENAIQRLVFFEDGMKLFKRSPIIGLGLSGFEDQFRSVQSFWYVTQNVHNHYIEVMVDKGIIGLIVFVGLLAVCAAAVIFERRKKKDGDPLAPSLGAAVVFMAGHAAVELVFSAYHYLPIAFGVMAVIGVTCGEAIPRPKLKPRAQTVAAWTAAAMLAVFGVQMTGSIMAYKALENGQTLRSLQKAASLDPYEWTSYALSYVVSTGGADVDPAVRSRADKYAARLEKKDTFTVSYYLAMYYLQTGRPEKAVEQAEKHVTQISSDASGWQETFDLLRQYYDGSDTLREGVLRIADLLDAWNGKNMGSIELSQEAVDFIAKVRGET